MAPCGSDCSACPAYQATAANDTAALTKLAGEWGQKSAEDMICYGCRAVDQKRFGYCSECALATCAKAADQPSCAHCDSYPCPSTAKLGDEGKAKLDAIRAGLIK
jgi:hypothetical protein